MEKVFIILKPDGMDLKLIDRIMYEIYELDLKITETLYVTPDRSRLEQHYDHIKNTHFFKDTIDFMMCEHHMCNELFTIVAQGEEAIKKIRELAGSTNPYEAEENSLRGRYGKIVDGRFENVLHASSSVMDAEREIKIWYGER